MRKHRHCWFAEAAGQMPGQQLWAQSRGSLELTYANLGPRPGLVSPCDWSVIKELPPQGVSLVWCPGIWTGDTEAVTFLPSSSDLIKDTEGQKISQKY